MPTTHSIEDLKRYHSEALQFFGSELLLLKEVVPKITDDKLAKAATLLMSCSQTGAALLQLSHQIDCFSSESVMLARAFMEKVTNFCYVGICDEKEFRAFILHPIYKQYHNVAEYKMEDDFDSLAENIKIKEEKQKKLRQSPIVQEALSIFSETKSHLNWTKKTLNERIAAIEKWGKLLDVFFTINKSYYYSDASETLHGSLYGCSYGIGAFDPDFDYKKEGELDKKLYKDNTCVLLHLGFLIHESFTLISYTHDIKELWGYSYKNRNRALGLLYHVLEKENKSLKSKANEKGQNAQTNVVSS